MEMTTHTMKSWDGAEIFYRAWIPAVPTDKAVLLFHRGHEHSGRLQETAEALNLDDAAIFAWDQRGHGHSSGERGFAPNLAAVIKDAETFARHICRTHGVKLQNTVVIGHSIGAVIATAWVHDYAPPIRSLVLAAPAFRVKLYVPFALPLLRLKQRFLGPGIVKSFVKASMLTHDPQQVAELEKDPLLFRQIAVNMLLDLHDTSTRLLKDAGALTIPTLILAAGKDWIVKLSPQKTFFNRLSSPFKQFDFLPGAYHSILQETNRARTIDRIRAFITDAFARPVCKKHLLSADQSGFTRAQVDLLRTPGKPHWLLQRLFLKTVGCLSRGIRLGWKTGFNSGRTLDFVYQNQPAGWLLLGKLIDYFYLNSVGWRGIRIRRQNLESALRSSIDQFQREGREIRILDIASGPGRYLLDVMKNCAAPSATALLRDNDPANLQAAKSLAQEMGIHQITTAAGDAFDRDSLASITPRPSIAIVSGLYELFPDNAPIRRSLEGLAASIDEGGHLIYTCQPWHPQLEFIARVLTDAQGQPWIMRCRTQAEMDALVEAAGFEKISQEIDPFGIFTVSVARRRPK